MTANVRCVGMPAIHRDLAGEPFNIPAVDPCGWKGERFPSVDWDQVFEERATVKPCPRCGGPVELIPRDA